MGMGSTKVREVYEGELTLVGRAQTDGVGGQGLIELIGYHLLIAIRVSLAVPKTFVGLFE